MSSVVFACEYDPQNYSLVCSVNIKVMTIIHDEIIINYECTFHCSSTSVRVIVVLFNSE